MKHSAEYYIEHLEMEPHVEGGYFKECLLEKEDRDLWSSIYFMLAKGEVSHFHRLKSDEVWYYHDGNALTIYMIDEEGKLTAAKLGLDLEKGEVPQVLVPKGMIFGSAMEEEGFSLVGCMVSPCFKYEEFELFDRKELLEKYPYEVSGGQKQRVAVARALITKPQLILADEPTGALDSKATDSLLDLFGEINNEGQTILMVTHSTKAASHAKRVLFIKDGEVFHQLYRGNMTNEELYAKISDTLTILTTGGEHHE